MEKVMSPLHSKQFFLETYGCSANRSDSERLLRILANQNWSKAESPEKADLVILNTCGVKNPTERKILRRLRELEEQQPWATAVTGCLPNMSLPAIKEAHPNFGVIFDTKNTHKFNSILTRLEQGERGVEQFSVSQGTVLEKLDILPLPMNPLIGILTINEGCDGNCTFCGTILARGRTMSHSPRGLIDQAKTMLQNGAQELWITSQDTGAYRFVYDNGVVWELPELLEGLCRLQYRFRLRIGMINPEHILRLQFKRTENQLFDVITQNTQIFAFLHIPVQSGNNRILELMKRRYTVQDFKRIIKSIKNRFPQITLSTDIIVGFPTETENEFQDTIELIQWLRPPVLNVSRYGARPKTAAARMNGQIHERIAKERSRYLAKIWQPIAYEEHQKWLGWEGQCLISEKGKMHSKQRVKEEKIQKSVIARNWAYKTVVLPADVPIGSYIRVKIIKARNHYLIGQILSNESYSKDLLHITVD